MPYVFNPFTGNFDYFQSGGPVSAGSLDPVYTTGRLALTPTVLFSATDVSTLYYTCYQNDNQNHNIAPFSIVLWNGTALQYYTSATITLSLASILADKVYDVFIRDSGGGVLALDLSVAWVSSDSRDFSLDAVNGMLTKQGDPTRRWLGTICGSINGACSYDIATRYVYNAYNKRVILIYTTAPQSSWSLTTGGFSDYREMGGGLGLGKSYLRMVTGDRNAWFKGTIEAQCYGPANLQDYSAAIGINDPGTFYPTSTRGTTAGPTPAASVGVIDTSLPQGSNKIIATEYWNQSVATAGNAYFGNYLARSWQLMGSYLG